MVIKILAFLFLVTITTAEDSNSSVDAQEVSILQIINEAIEEAF